VQGVYCRACCQVAEIPSGDVHNGRRGSAKGEACHKLWHEPWDSHAALWTSSSVSNCSETCSFSLTPSLLPPSPVAVTLSQYYLTLSSLTTQTNSYPFLLLHSAFSMWSPLIEREQGNAQWNGTTIGSSEKNKYKEGLFYSCIIYTLPVTLSIQFNISLLEVVADKKKFFIRGTNQSQFLDERIITPFNEDMLQIMMEYINNILYID